MLRFVKRETKISKRRREMKAFSLSFLGMLTLATEAMELENTKANQQKHSSSHSSWARNTVAQHLQNWNQKKTTSRNPDPIMVGLRATIESQQASLQQLTNNNRSLQEKILEIEDEKEQLRQKLEKQEEQQSTLISVQQNYTSLLLPFESPADKKEFHKKWLSTTLSTLLTHGTPEDKREATHASINNALQTHAVFAKETSHYVSTTALRLYILNWNTINSMLMAKLYYTALEKDCLITLEKEEAEEPTAVTIFLMTFIKQALSSTEDKEQKIEIVKNAFSWVENLGKNNESLLNETLINNLQKIYHDNKEILSSNDADRLKSYLQGKTKETLPLLS